MGRDWRRSLKSKIHNSKLTIAALALTAALLSTAPLVEAQQAKKLPRIGWLSAASSSAEVPEKQALEGLRALGWAEGKNVVIEYRHAAGNSGQLSRMASELVRLNVDVIVTFSAG